MKINELHIVSFGMLSDKDVSFCDGLNVIEGDNETGKSTVGAFIRFIFYGLDKPGREKYVAWGRSGCSGSLTLTSKGSEYRIERELLLTRAKDRISIYKDGDTLRTDKAPWELFIGVPENVFENTAFTGDLGSAVGGAGLPEAIENIVFSADEAVSTKKALKKLDENRVALYYKNRKGGKIYELENNVSELEFRLNAAKSESEHIFSLDDSIRTRRARLQSNKERIDKITAQLHDLDTYRRLRELDEHEENLRSLAEGQSKLEKLAEKYSNNGYLPDREFADGLHSLQASAVELKENAGKAALELQKADGELKNSKSSGILRIAAGIGGVNALRDMYDGFDEKLFKYKKYTALPFILAAALAVTAALLAFIGLFLPYGAVCAAVAAVCVIIGAYNAVKTSKLKRGLEKLAAKLGCDDPDEIPDLLAGLDDAKDASDERTAAYNRAKEEKDRADRRLSELDGSVRGFSAKYRETDVSGLPGLISEVETVVSEVSNVRKQIEMAQYRTRTSAERVKGDDRETLRARLCGALQPDELDSFNADERRTELNLLVRQNEAISEKISSEEQSFAAANATFTLPSVIYAKLLDARRQLEEAQMEFKATSMAYEKLAEASAALRSSISPTLARGAGQYMKGFSGGKYDGLGISNKLEISYTGGGMTHRADTLSSGTQDIAYVSLRLSLMDLIFPDKAPAFFDDTFARVDDKRALRIMQTLASSGTQSIVFTCHKRDRDFAASSGGRVITL